MYAGDEFYGDDITSGTDFDEDVSFRAFCESENCLWSGDSCATEDMADGQLEAHTTTTHPGQPVQGSIDES